jgi:hypothetical protein
MISRIAGAAALGAGLVALAGACGAMAQPGPNAVWG